MTGLRTSLFIAYKTIARGRRGTLVLMVLILSLSFFNTLFIPGVFSGLLDTIIGLEVNTYTSHVMVAPQKEPTPKEFISHETALRGAIETIPGVVGTARTYLTAGSISFDKNKTGVFKRVSAQVIGIDPSQASRILTVPDYLVAGEFLQDDDRDQIVLAAALAGGYDLPEPNDLGGARVGDKVRVVYGNGVSREYRVKGITNILFGPALTNAYITAREAESVLGASDQASQILVKAQSEGMADSLKARIQAMEPKLFVQTYFDLITAIKPVLDAFAYIALIVSVISILVATVTIFVMIYINAVTKRRQIGILKAIGIPDHVIIFSYVFQSLFYCAAGIAVGLGLTFGVILPLLSIHPIMLPFGELHMAFSPFLIAESAGGLVLAGFLAGFIPSRIVVKENILQSIWG